jgi:hypothetical protein
VIGLSQFALLAEKAAMYLQATQDYGQGRPTRPAVIRFVVFAWEAFGSILLNRMNRSPAIGSCP